MKNADLVIVLTIAKKIGAPNTVARVRNPSYRKQILDMKDELRISMILNPEKETANEIFSLINLPSVDQIERFAREE